MIRPHENGWMDTWFGRQCELPVHSELQLFVASWLTWRSRANSNGDWFRCAAVVRKMCIHTSRLTIVRFLFFLVNSDAMRMKEKRCNYKIQAPAKFFDCAGVKLGGPALSTRRGGSRTSGSWRLASREPSSGAFPPTTRRCWLCHDDRTADTAPIILPPRPFHTLDHNQERCSPLRANKICG